MLVENYTTFESNPIMLLFDQCGIGSIFRISDHFSATQWQKLDVAHDVFIPQGMHFSLCTTIARDSRHFAALSILRSKHQGDFSNRELHLFQSLTSHMVRALRAYEEITALREHRDAMEDVFDLLGCGVVLLDAKGDALFLNEGARALIDQKDGLALEHRQLTALREPDRSRLAFIIARAIAADASIRQAGTLMLQRRASITPLPCLAIPISKGAGHLNFQRAPAAMLLIGRTPEDSAIGNGPLARLYGLSARQAELAALLLEGQSVTKAATIMQISENTAKTHMRRLLNKIGAANLSELDELILNGPLGFLEPSRLSAMGPKPQV